MSDITGLDIIIGAKTQDAEAGLKRVQQGLAQTAIASQKIDSSRLDKLGKSSTTTRFAVQNLANVFRDIPFAINNPAIASTALDHVFGSLNMLTAEAGSFKGAMKSLAASLTGTGGIFLAVNVIGSAIALFGDKIFKTGDNVEDLADKAKDAADKIRSIGDSIGESTGSVQGQITEVQALGKVLEDTNKSYTERKNALEELKKVNKSYFGDLSLEKSSYEQIQGAIEGYTKALVQQAVIKGLEDDISQLTKTIFDAKRAYTEAADAVTKKNKEINDTKLSSLAAATPGQSILDSKISQLHDLQDNLKKSADVLGGLNGKFNDVTNEIQKQLEESLKLKPLTENSDTKKAKDSIDKIGEVLKNLRIAIDEVNNNPLILDVDKPLKEIGLIQDAIKRLRELGAKDSIIVNLRAQIDVLSDQVLHNKIQQSINGDNLTVPITIKTEARFVPLGENFRTGLQKQFDEMQEAIKKAADNMALRIGKLGFKLPDNFFKLPPEQQEKITKNLESINDVVENTLGDVFSKLGENLGSMKNPFSGIFEMLGGALVQLGKYVILSSALVSKITKVLNAALTPLGVGPALAVGVGLITLGSLLKSVPQFAEGGLVTGPTMGLVGERGPEVIFPLDRIREFMQPGIAGNVNINVTGKLRGRDIYLSNARETDKNKRTI